MPPRTAGPLLSSVAAVAETCSFGSVTPAISDLRVPCFVGLVLRLARLALGQKKRNLTLLTSETSATEAWELPGLKIFLLVSGQLVALEIAKASFSLFQSYTVDN